MMTDFHIDHLSNPRNSGKLKNYDKIIEAKSDYCGDMIRFYIKFNGDKIENVGYEVFGCWAIISACSIISEYMEGKTIKELRDLTEKDIERICQVDKVPEIKRHCFLLPIKILKEI